MSWPLSMQLRLINGRALIVYSAYRVSDDVVNIGRMVVDP